MTFRAGRRTPCRRCVFSIGGDGALHVLDDADPKGYVKPKSYRGKTLQPSRFIQYPGGRGGIGRCGSQALPLSENGPRRDGNSSEVHGADVRGERMDGLAATNSSRNVSVEVEGHSVLLRRVAFSSEDSEAEARESTSTGLNNQPRQAIAGGLGYESSASTNARNLSSHLQSSGLGLCNKNTASPPTSERWLASERVASADKESPPVSEPTVESASSSAVEGRAASSPVSFLKTRQALHLRSLTRFMLNQLVKRTHIPVLSKPTGKMILRGSSTGSIPQIGQ